MTEETIRITDEVRNSEEGSVRIEYYTLDGRRPEIMVLKDRDTAKDPEEFDGHWYKCPTCGKYAGGLKGNFCHVCGQRLKWEERL